VSSARFLRLDDAIRLASCESTQDLCRRLASEGAPEGTIVIADEQTGGRGREGRRWHSPAEAGLYTSFLLRPRIEPSRWLIFTPLVALALAEAIDALRRPAVARNGGSRAPMSEGSRSGRMMIKWPNDVYGGCGKVAGILAESGEGCVVVGIGVNLLPAREDFPPEIREHASSLRLEGFHPVPGRDAVLDELDARLERSFRRLLAGETGWLREGLRERFFLRGLRVGVGQPGSAALEGIARDLGPNGELLLETGAGLRTVVSGAIEWIGLSEG
jgi:BirA family biotin operon repressor/biotin-[acetyl-CoA-carboxylase] ligase